MSMFHVGREFLRPLDKRTGRPGFSQLRKTLGEIDVWGLQGDSHIYTEVLEVKVSRVTHQEF